MMNRAVSSSYLLVLVLFCISSFRGQLPEGKPCIFKDARPKKAELQTLGITDDIVDYSSYSRVGTCLLNDENGNKIKKLEVDYGSVTPRIEEIFRLWMNGNGATPVSWTGLVACLKSAQLITIIERIESEYCLMHMENAKSHSGSGSMDEEHVSGFLVIVTGILKISYCTPFIAVITAIVGIVFIVGCRKNFGRGKRDLHILVTGRVGAGKSALVNSIIGEYVAEEDDQPYEETTNLIKYEKRAGHSTISVYDSPGFQDDSETENQYLDYVGENCSEVDLNLYCVKMRDRLRPSEIDAIKKLSFAFGKKKFWRKTLFVLTFANEIALPKQKHSSVLFQHFRDQMSGWKTLLEKSLTEKVGVSKEAAANVPVVPVGFHDKLSLPPAKCDDWLHKLWFHILVGLKIDNLNEQDSSWEASMIEYLRSKGRDNLRICVVGRTGTGKSALVNSMVGNTDAHAEEAEEDDTASRVTDVVAMYEKSIENCTISIYDSPGLDDDQKITDQYLKDIEEKCGEVDLNLYCVKMNDKMNPSEIDTIKKFSCAFGKNEFWRKTLFVLTFANEIKLPKQKKYSMLLQHFRDRLTEWKTLLQKALTDKAGITEEAAANVPVIPAGYYDKPYLPAAKGENWLSKLRTQCFDQIKDVARPSINWGQLQPSEEVKKEDITKKTQPKQPNTDQDSECQT